MVENWQLTSKVSIAEFKPAMDTFSLRGKNYNLYDYFSVKIIGLKLIECNYVSKVFSNFITRDLFCRADVDIRRDVKINKVHIICTI